MAPIPVPAIAHRRPLVRRFVVVLVAGAFAFGGAAAPGSLGPPWSPAGARAAEAPFRLDLSGRGDFVAQTNFVQCVGASMQMMLNMIGPDDDRSAATQLELQTLARALSGPRPDGTSRKGASVRGWAAGLNELGAGPYRLAASPELEAILRTAARSMRETGRPVGLLVWAGRHAWVLGGFTATADPLTTDDFEVLEVIILDPLYPYGSRTWGPSPKPRQTLSLEQLARQFVPRRTSQRSSQWLAGYAGKYVIVMPYGVVAARTQAGFQH